MHDAWITWPLSSEVRVLSRIGQILKRLVTKVEMESWEDYTTGKVSAKNLVKKTVSRYKDNKDAGALAVIQWIVDACGCKYKVQTVESFPDLPKQMENDLLTNYEGFPVLEKKMISAKLCQLMELLIKKCEHSILYDGFLIHNLCHILCKLSKSEIRGFRYVSTLAGLSVASQLAELCHNLKKQRNNLNKQLNTERDFTVEGEVSMQESLNSSLNELSENLQETTLLMQLLLEQIFKHRIRDVSGKIRLFCCEKLKSWMEKYPTIFVTDYYQEMVYLLLHDPLKEIRLFSLKIIESLISTGEPRESTHNFLTRDKARLIAMTLDVSTEIAVEAVRVLALVDKFYQTLLDQKEREGLFLLVFSKHKQVAQEAGAYLLQVFRAIMEKDGSHLLENIACFFMEWNGSRYPGYETVYVDSLWDICKELCDWKEFIECFLRQKATTIKITFLRIMLSCIHRAVTGETPRYKGQKEFKLTVMTIKRSISKMIEEERKKVTEVFMDYLPEIMKQNMEEENILKEILKIPFYLQTEVYGCNINQKPLEALLETLKEVFLFTNDDGVLNSIVEVYDLFNSPEAATFNTTTVRCGMLMGTVVDATRKAMETYQHCVQESFPPADVTYATEKWTKKLCYLSKCIDIRSYNIFTEMLEFIHADISKKFPVSDEIVCYMLRSCFHGMKMNVEVSTEEDKNSECFQHIVDNLNKFIQFLTTILSSSSKIPPQKEAFNIFCELVYFQHMTYRNYPNLAELMYKPDGYVEDRLISVLNEWVFIVPDPNEESVAEIALDERERMLRGYWSLLTCYAVPIKRAEFLFKHYTLCPEYEDCLQQMLQVLLKFNSRLCAEILVNTLWSLFHELQEESAPRSLELLKSMARKFAVVLEANPGECREAVVAVHKKAIHLIGQHKDWPKYINFLEFFIDFAQITPVSDVDDILEYLQQNMPVKKHHQIRKSAPFNHYVSCLSKVKKTV